MTKNVTIHGSSLLLSALRAQVVVQASDAVDVATSGLLAAAIVRSSGPYSQLELNQKNNPYAKKHGSPLLDPGTVNVQTGQFRSMWNSHKIDPLHAQVTNSDPIAKYLVTEDGEGTQFMFHRGVDDAAQEDLVKRMPAVTHVRSLPKL